MEANDIPKAYDPTQWEEHLYRNWEKSGFFDPDICIEQGVTKADAEPFSVLMPPPNVTGVLHLGHAMENSIMDVMARQKRMCGFRTLFLPGADHAAIATQARVEKHLVEAGMKNPRQELGREGLLEKVRVYADESKDTITRQVRAMGSSCDWSRFVYTFDEPRAHAVNEMFRKMYDDGLIYRGDRIVNWDPNLQTTVSDDEIVREEETTKFYYLRYGPFIISTARPETKFGDKYVVMHPDDDRYREYEHGQKIDLEWINGPITATIVKDEAVDPSFGTGVMTITPWHDVTDFEIAERHDLEREQIIDFDGKLLPIAGEFAGMPILEARKGIIERLQKKGLVEKIDDEYVHSIARNERGGGLIEPQIKRQWFVAVNREIPGRGKTLKDLMREAVTTGLDGDPEKRVSIQPERFEKVYLHWIDNLRDWCISRQIWWGHRIPVWYKKRTTDNGQQTTEEEIYCGTEAPEGEGWEQGSDTLDTWFSSGLWSFSTLGWASDDAKDLETFHPTSFMQMGYEILFFWMARMILMTGYGLETIPFRDVYIHGILRDKDGRKFSKSLGNGIDPIEIGREYGTDALRLALLSDITPGNDARFSYDKVENARNFVNKFWNIARYVDTISKASGAELEACSLSDYFILARLERVIREVDTHFADYRFSLAIETLRAFTWDDFADWYVEIHKVERNDAVLRHVFDTLIRLWHPFIPFVTEAIHETRDSEGLLMVAAWPKASEASPEGTEAETLFDELRELITKIRNLRAAYRIDPGTRLTVAIRTREEAIRKSTPVIERLSRTEMMDEIHEGTTADIVVSERLGASVSLEGVIDTAIERTRLEKELSSAEQYAGNLIKKLENKRFTDRAPKQIVEQTRTLLEETRVKIRELKQHLEAIS